MRAVRGMNNVPPSGPGAKQQAVVHRFKELGLRGITSRFVGASDEYIAGLEGQAGFRLPDCYKGFIRDVGASLFSEDSGFRPLVPSPWAVNGVESFDVFYGMSEKLAVDLRRVNSRLQGVIGTGRIAIGHDPGSNLILLDASGAVYFFDRETGQEFLCAKDFASFLASFEPR